MILLEGRWKFEQKFQKIRFFKKIQQNFKIFFFFVKKEFLILESWWMWFMNNPKTFYHPKHPCVSTPKTPPILDITTQNLISWFSQQFFSKVLWRQVSCPSRIRVIKKSHSKVQHSTWPHHPTCHNKLKIFFYCLSKFIAT